MTTGVIRVSESMLALGGGRAARAAAGPRTDGPRREVEPALGLPLTAILGLLLTGTEVQRWRYRHAQPDKRLLDRMSGQDVFHDTSRFDAEATRPALAGSDITPIATFYSSPQTRPWLG